MKQLTVFRPSTTLGQPSSARGRTAMRLVMLSLLTLLPLGLSSAAAQAQTYKEQTLHSFTDSTTDGSGPQSDLINVNGTLYSTTSEGGANNTGTIFSIDPSTNAVTTLYSFGTAATTGSAPNSLINVNGVLYGTTYNGGVKGFGTLFSFDPATNTETTLYAFGTSGGAARPVGALTVVNNILYGASFGGGTQSSGTIFSFDPSSLTEKTLHSFGVTIDDGTFPFAGLIAVNGILYGTTLEGGTSGNGILFSFDSATSTENILHTFMGTSQSNDGQAPVARLTNVNGTLYGTTEDGGVDNAGTVFSLVIAQTTYQVLYSFTGSGGDGASPEAGLLNVNGLLYGTTYLGGINNQGTVYSLNPSTKTETALYHFQSGTDGIRPATALLSVNGVFYGTTVSGGTSSDGTVFSLTPVVAPTAHNDSARTSYNTTLTITAPGVLGNDTNGGDTATTAAVVTNPTHGTLTFSSNGSFKYVPSTGYLGSDSFTYKDHNAAGYSNVATCTLTVQARTPIASNDHGTGYYNTALVITAPGVLGNDSNGGSTPITAALVTQPSHGTLTFKSDGSFTYTPTSGFLGTDSFTYQDTNPVGKSNVATCTISILARTPIAVNDHGTVTHNTTATFAAPAVLGNDYPGTNTGVTAAIVTNPSHGTLTFNSNGSFVYKPTIGFIGTDSFTYKDTNSVGTSNTATCTLTVQ